MVNYLKKLILHVSIRLMQKVDFKIGNQVINTIIHVVVHFYVNLKVELPRYFAKVKMFVKWTITSKVTLYIYVNTY